jgi:hypothetical protein
MSQFVFISLSVAAVVSCLMALRMYGNWLAISACGDSYDYEPLSKLRETLIGWVARHLFCAGVATILCVMIHLVPSLHAFPGADALLAGYGVLSLLFASLDHALSQLVLIAMKQIRINQS